MPDSPAGRPESRRPARDARLQRRRAVACLRRRATEISSPRPGLSDPLNRNIPYAGIGIVPGLLRYRRHTGSLDSGDRRGAGRYGAAAGIGVEGGGAARRAEIDGTRTGAAVLGCGGGVYAHAAYRVGRQ